MTESDPGAGRRTNIQRPFQQERKRGIICCASPKCTLPVIKKGCQPSLVYISQTQVPVEGEIVVIVCCESDLIQDKSGLSIGQSCRAVCTGWPHGSYKGRCADGVEIMAVRKKERHMINRVIELDEWLSQHDGVTPTLQLLLCFCLTERSIGASDGSDVYFWDLRAIVLLPSSLLSGATVIRHFMRCYLHCL